MPKKPTIDLRVEADDLIALLKTKGYEVKRVSYSGEWTEVAMAKEGVVLKIDVKRGRL